MTNFVNTRILKSFSIICCIIYPIFLNSTPENPSASHYRLIEYEKTFTIDESSMEEGGYIETFLPFNIAGFQEIIQESITPTPSSTRTNTTQRKIKWTFTKHSKNKFTARFLILIRSNGLQNVPNDHSRISENDDISQYLKNGVYLSIKSPKIRNIAAAIEGSTDLEKTRNIFRFVTENLTYDNTMPEELTVKKALELKKGDCTEFSELMISLCRLNNIPARMVTGPVVQNGRNPMHNWVDVYLNNYGWVSFDPTNAKNKSLDKVFGFLKNNYIRHGMGNSRYDYTYRFNGAPATGLRSHYNFNDVTYSESKEVFKAYTMSNITRFGHLFRQLVESNPNTEKALCLGAILNARNGKFKEALKLAQAGIINAKSKSQRANGVFIMSKILALQKKEEQSLRLLSTIVEELDLTKIEIMNDPDYSHIDRKTIRNFWRNL